VAAVEAPEDHRQGNDRKQTVDSSAKKIGMKFEKEFEAHGGICVQYFKMRDEEFN
jgi:hypothetical protein